MRAGLPDIAVAGAHRAGDDMRMKVMALLLFLLPVIGRAETPPAPEPPPIPKGYTPLPEEEQAVEPEVTVTTRANGDRIEEYRIRGQLYMIKVTPRYGEPYYLVDREGNRQFRRTDEADVPVTPPQWVIKRW